VSHLRSRAVVTLVRKEQAGEKRTCPWYFMDMKTRGFGESAKIWGTREKKLKTTTTTTTTTTTAAN
jgi:hypothetical protein